MKETTRDELDRVFRKQKTAFAGDRTPDLAARLSRLRALDAMLIEYRQPIRDAISADFGNHHAMVTDLFESGAVIARSRHIQSQLASWMAPEQRELPAAVHGSSTAEVIHQPKGVLGNIAPWNFPLECALVMTADMLAAGNRVIVKSAELAPRISALLGEAIARHFPEDVLTMVHGGHELSAYFASLPWDHLTYTGGGRVGRLVMAAAAANLTPLTLELGGKNPAVFADDGFDDALIERFLYFRVFKGGQVCTSPDHVLVPEGRISEWVEKAKRLWTGLYPKYVGHPEATGAINQTHFNRVMALVQEARARGRSIGKDLPIRALRASEAFRTRAGRPEQDAESPPDTRRRQRPRAHVHLGLPLGSPAPEGAEAARHPTNDQQSPSDGLSDDVRVQENARQLTDHRRGRHGVHRASAPLGRPSSCASTARTPRRGCDCDCRP